MNVSVGRSVGRRSFGRSSSIDRPIMDGAVKRLASSQSKTDFVRNLCARARRSREDDAERLSHRAQRIHLEETGGDDAIHGLSRGRTETRITMKSAGSLSYTPLCGAPSSRTSEIRRLRCW